MITARDKNFRLPEAGMEETRVAWFPVHCCCQPEVLFGFISLPADGEKFANGQKFAVLDRRGRPHDVELKQLVLFIPKSKRTLSFIRQQELAVYSDDRPIKFWRTIPGFREVVDKGRVQ